MFCHKCGRELKDDAVRCPFCNADTSAYLEDDNSSLREILRLSEELNEEVVDSGDVQQENTVDLSCDENRQLFAEETPEEQQAAEVDSKDSDPQLIQDKGEESSEDTINYSARSEDGFYIPKRAAIKAGMLPPEEDEEGSEKEQAENTADEEKTEVLADEDPQEEAEDYETRELETIDAEEENEASEEEYVDENEAFFSSYVPINEIPEEPEEEEEEAVDVEVDYEDGFVDDGYYNDYEYEEDPPYDGYEELEEEEEKPKKHIKKRWIVIPLLIIVLGAAAWFGLSEFVINSSASEAIEAFSQQKYDTAAKIYNESVKDSPIQMWLFESKISSYMDEILDNHRDRILSYDEAKKALNSVIALDEDKFTQKAKEALAQIDALEASREAYTTGQQYFSDGEYIKAAEEFSKVIESDPDYSKAMASRDRSFEKYKEDVLLKTSECETSDDYRAAIELLNEAVKHLPDDKDIINRLDECSDGLQKAIIAEAISNIQSLIDSQNFSEALDLIDETLEKYPNNSDVLAVQETCIESYISWAKSQAQSYLDSERFMDAIELIDSMLKEFPDNEELISSRDECVRVYVDYAVVQADELMDAGNYEDALAVIESALSDLPNSDTLKNKKEEIEKAMPISLMDVCPPYDGTNIKIFNNDSLSSFKIENKVYREGFTLYCSNGVFFKGNGIAKINLEGSYSRLTFNAGKIDGGRDVDGILDVYIDGELVDTFTLDSEGGLQSFEINLSYGSELTFELSPESGSSTPSFGFTNLTLYR